MRKQNFLLSFIVLTSIVLLSVFTSCKKNVEVIPLEKPLKEFIENVDFSNVEKVSSLLDDVFESGEITPEVEDFMDDFEDIADDELLVFLDGLDANNLMNDKEILSYMYDISSDEFSSMDNNDLQILNIVAERFTKEPEELHNEAFLAAAEAMFENDEFVEFMPTGFEYELTDIVKLIAPVGVPVGNSSYTPECYDNYYYAYYRNIQAFYNAYKIVYDRYKECDSKYEEYYKFYHEYYYEELYTDSNSIYFENDEYFKTRVASFRVYCLAIYYRSYHESRMMFNTSLNADYGTFINCGIDKHEGGSGN
ncbi:MAG: hypothetical protein KAG96_05945 [Ichthyobacteriaceae bacterium]|nr:hypothetical protein [Ichthyobacteriaceae bacterium]